MLHPLVVAPAARVAVCCVAALVAADAAENLQVDGGDVPLERPTGAEPEIIVQLKVYLVYFLKTIYTFSEPFLAFVAPMLEVLFRSMHI